jgi:hypothetical protein
MGEQPVVQTRSWEVGPGHGGCGGALGPAARDKEGPEAGEERPSRCALANQPPPLSHSLLYQTKPTPHIHNGPHRRSCGSAQRLCSPRWQVLIPKCSPSAPLPLFEQLLTLADPKGLKFEKISDAVDDINVAKLKASDAYGQSEFDSEKDKAGFRQFVDTNESSRRFYM